VVRQKISAVWIFATLGLSIVFGTLFALRFSISLTPSLRRKWDIGEEVRPDELNKWHVDLPTKVDVERFEEFLDFLVKKFDSMAMSSKDFRRSVIKGLSFYKVKRVDNVVEIRFFYNIESLYERCNTRNDLIIVKNGDVYDVELLVMDSKEGADVIGRLIRGIMMEWSIELGRIV